MSTHPFLIIPQLLLSVTGYQINVPAPDPAYLFSPPVLHACADVAAVSFLAPTSSTTAHAPPTAPSPIRAATQPNLFSGFGSANWGMSTHPFLIIPQVSRPHVRCFRSNDVCIIVLPNPGTLYSIFVECCRNVSTLLMLAGDVESNPGPDEVPTRVLLEQLLATQKEISQNIADIKSEQQSTKSWCASVNSRLGLIETSIDELRSTTKRVEGCEYGLADVASTIGDLKRKIDDLENRSRRNNLIIHGIKCDVNETADQLKEKVCTNIFSTKLQVDVSTVERIHRLGRNQGTRPRPVIMSFRDYNEKMSILTNAKKLKGSGVFINEDYSYELRQIRKKLWDSSQADRDRGDKVTLSYNKLKINNVTYQWDNNLQSRVRLNRPPSPQAVQPASD
ncbi:uncharacterized protein LOC115327481 [Ixodes scapularis]|uniref:uncharacterized protein LOC115327481 n=1 Tax=Ixodes scapularis TaxID=6945 RepID=UPI001A9CE649|nr:uncharacterized protein LOC115327481 [Ixodes scapularis]